MPQVAEKKDAEYTCSGLNDIKRHHKTSLDQKPNKHAKALEPVVQSIVSLTSTLVVKTLNVL